MSCAPGTFPVRNSTGGVSCLEYPLIPGPRAVLAAADRFWIGKLDPSTLIIAGIGLALLFQMWAPVKRVKKAVRQEKRKRAYYAKRYKRFDRLGKKLERIKKRSDAATIKHYGSKEEFEKYARAARVKAIK